MEPVEEIRGILGEFKDNGFNNNLKHERGVISMARSSNLNSAGSQFFIMTEYAPHLDGGYAAFGKVIEGMDEVDRIANVDKDGQNRPYDDQIMSSITVETLDIQYKEVEKM